MIARWALAILICSLMSGWAGYQRGLNIGSLTVQAKHDRATLEQTNSAMAEYRLFLDENLRTHREWIQESAERVRFNEHTTKELRDALQATAALRAAVECRYGDGVMQQLTAARDRAAEAASGSGPSGAVSGAGTGTER